MTEKKDSKGMTTEDRYVDAAERLWESARNYMHDGWRGRPDEWVAEVKAMRAEVRRAALLDALHICNVQADKDRAYAARPGQSPMAKRNAEASELVILALADEIQSLLGPVR
jgi:hypothetical protein